jgi:FKBP-type peptidyl-prolyl cis-trans isomerase FkpA/FKBP-type peptidyl-prolyl cis-trans isomerase FklB
VRCNRIGQVVAATVAMLVVAEAAVAAGPELKTDEDRTMYALGLALSQNLVPFKLSEKEMELVKAGLSDGALGKEKKVDLQTFGPKINALAQARLASSASAEKKASEPYLAKAAAEKGATKTASGLVYKEVKAGAGDAPKATDTVKVHYTGKLTDGTVFDSSVQRGEPATFPLNGVIKCWTEGVQMMKVGGKATLVCPSDIAYGDQGRPPQIKPGATLVFDVELLEIVKR